MKVGIVMPTINLWNKYTKPALDSVMIAASIALKEGIESSLLLVDNASTDETQSEAPKAFDVTNADIPYEYHRNDEMWSFSKTVNFGVKHFLNKDYDYVLILNNDIVLHADAITRLVERFEKGSVAMATCLDVTGECLGDPLKLADLKSNDKEACEETPHPCFSAFMINRECWDTVGEFDEVFAPAYYEDNDYHYRIQLAGLLAVTYPPAMFFHYGSRTQLEALPRPMTDSANNHHAFIRKWGGNPKRETYKVPYGEITLSIKSTKQNPSA